MEKYDYMKAILSDLRVFVAEKIDRKQWFNNPDGLGRYLCARCCIADEVTGGNSETYFKDVWQAEEAICHNMDLLADAVYCFASSYRTVIEDPEYADVLIRQYLLDKAVETIIRELKKTGFFG